MGVVKELGNDDGGVKHGALLARLCDAVAAKDRTVMAGVRAEMLADMSAEQLVDAVGVSAMFHMMNRVANATGTPLDPIMSQAGPAISEAIGASGFHSRADTPEAKP
jgi:hypothetical protein